MIGFFAALSRFFSHGPITGHVEPKAPRIHIDSQGWLHGPRVTTYPSVRYSAMTSPRPLGIVWHYTATDSGTGRRMAKRIRRYKRGRDRSNSWSILVTQKGEILQSVSCLEGAWHCKEGRLLDEHGKGHRINASTVGIELEGHGRVFSPAQIEAAEQVVRAIVFEYELPENNCRHGHKDFDPSRRADPGPVWNEILEGIIGRVFT